MKYFDVKETMDTILHEVKYSKTLFEPSIAFTFTRLNNLCGTVYKIFINNSDPELAKLLYMHECGHIIFSHARNMQLREDKFLRIKIAAAYDVLSDSFESKESLFEYFRKMVFNVCMDFEVNSKMFDENQWQQMNKLVQKLTENPDAEGMWPQDFGYPPGLTWNEYLNLILLKPKKFLNDFVSVNSLERKTEIQKGMNDTNQNSGQNENQNEKKDDEKQNSDDESEGRGEQQENQTQFQNSDDEQVADLSAAEVKKIIERIKEIAELHEGASFSDPNGNMKGMSRGNFGAVNVDFVEYNDMTDLLRKMRRLLFARKTMRNRRDELYNINRRKYDTNILIPKSVNQTVHRKPNLYLLFDVSGSVPAKLVNDLILTFKSFGSEFKHTKIVTWSMTLVEEFFIEEKIPRKYGGGTMIAPGIEYVYYSNKLTKDDVLFVISDFCDFLYEWTPVLQKIHCHKYAINWNPENAVQNPGFDKVLKQSDSAG